MKNNAIYFLVAFIMTAILGKIILPFLKKLKIGQTERLDGPRSHLRKQGTPTMGGITIILSMVIIGIGFCILQHSYEMMPVLLASLGFGIVGFIDDFKKLVLKNTEGLNPKLKMLGLLIVSAIYVLYLVNYKNIETSIAVPFTEMEIRMVPWLYILFSIVVMSFLLFISTISISNSLKFAIYCFIPFLFLERCILKLSFVSTT